MRLAALLSLLLFLLLSTCVHAQEATEDFTPRARIHRIVHEPTFLGTKFYYGTATVSGGTLRALMQDDPEALAELRGNKGLLLGSSFLALAACYTPLLLIPTFDSQRQDLVLPIAVAVAGLTGSYLLLGRVNRNRKRAAAVYNANSFPPPPPAFDGMTLRVGPTSQGVGLRAIF